MAALARFGLGARAFVHVVIGWLAIQIARGQSSQEANQQGALANVAHHSHGVALLWVLGVGFAAYAVWRLSEAVFGSAAEGHAARARVLSLLRGLTYAALAVSTFSFIAGTSRKGQNQQQETLTARVMKHTDGRWLVGLVGLIVVAVGINMIVEGATRKFEKELRVHEMNASTRSLVSKLGVVGTMARGTTFAIAGALVIDAAVTFNARKSTGLDGGLRKLAEQPYGPWLLGLLALGLIAFGLYGFAAARWAKT